MILVLIKLVWQLLKLPWHVLNHQLAPYQVRWGRSKICLAGLRQVLSSTHAMSLQSVDYNILRSEKQKKKKKTMGGPGDGQ